MLKILIAEDDVELRKLFQHVLIRNGYAVKGVSDGQEALEAMKFDGDWEVPHLFFEDGSIADW